MSVKFFAASLQPVFIYFFEEEEEKLQRKRKLFNIN